MTAVPRPGTIAALAGLLVAGCGDQVPAGVAGPAVPEAPHLLGRLTGLLRCAPLPVDSATRIVGPAGGTLQVGPHRLLVPPGALTGDVAITGVTRPEAVRRIDLRPEGLVFDAPASLTMSYDGCGLVGFLPLRIAYVSAELSILEYLMSVTDGSAREVTASLNHFSNYAVAW